MKEKNSKKRDQLNIDQIIQAGIVMIQNYGLDQLSMRKLAKELGVTPMALYRHVQDKEKLLDLIGEQVLSAIKETHFEGNWNEKAFKLHSCWRDIMLANPEVGKLLIIRFIPGPTTTWMAERLIEFLEESNIEEEDLMVLGDTLFIYTLGIINYDLTRGIGERGQHSQYIDPLETPRVIRLLPKLAQRDPEAMFKSGYDAIIRGFIHK